MSRKTPNVKKTRPWHCLYWLWAICHRNLH